MLPGMEHLRRAREDLSRQGEVDCVREALFDAASEFWSAVIDCDKWPAELRQKAEDLVEHLFRYGPIRTTIDRMSDSETEAARRELLAFVDAAERAACDDGDSSST